MSVLLHLSDSHFGTEVPAVMAALARLVASENPSLMVASGDITQRARRSEFARARAFFDQLAVPTQMVLPGNHDIPLFNPLARLFHPYANFCRVFGSELEPVIDLPDWLLIGVNTTRPRRHVDGEVSAAQIASVKARLAAAKPGQLRIVVTHQPMHVTQAEDETNLLHGHAAAARAWTEAGADLLLGGHIHLPFVRMLNERHPDLERELWVVQAGTALSARVRHDAPNSINLLRHVKEDGHCGCLIERWDYHAASDAFIQARAYRLTGLGLKE
ncbi:metallophosphoesterase family protein [Chitinimonas lacunae]|uniref:Metallophosphoesterase family protein n=1 Tax=Chitinimonas lacunae TaxID=1963018 RepID=A0ABV8MU08_9NEIS